MSQVAVLGRERRLFLTGLVALLISTGIAVVAGSYLSSIRDLLTLIPGLMVLVPPTINMRGSISGCSRPDSPLPCTSANFPETSSAAGC